MKPSPAPAEQALLAAAKGTVQKALGSMAEQRQRTEEPQ